MLKSDKSAYFSYAVHSAGNKAAEELVKVKFKRGGLTVLVTLVIALAAYGAFDLLCRIWTFLRRRRIAKPQEAAGEKASTPGRD